MADGQAEIEKAAGQVPIVNDGGGDERNSGGAPIGRRGDLDEERRHVDEVVVGVRRSPKSWLAWSSLAWTTPRAPGGTAGRDPRQRYSPAASRRSPNRYSTWVWGGIGAIGPGGMPVPLESHLSQRPGADPVALGSA